MKRSRVKVIDLSDVRNLQKITHISRTCLLTAGESRAGWQCNAVQPSTTRLTAAYMYVLCHRVNSHDTLRCVAASLREQFTRLHVVVLVV